MKASRSSFSLHLSLFLRDCQLLVSFFSNPVLPACKGEERQKESSEWKETDTEQNEIESENGLEKERQRRRQRPTVADVINDPETLTAHKLRLLCDVKDHQGTHVLGQAKRAMTVVKLPNQIQVRIRVSWRGEGGERAAINCKIETENRKETE